MGKLNIKSTKGIIKMFCIKVGILAYKITVANKGIVGKLHALSYGKRLDRSEPAPTRAESTTARLMTKVLHLTTVESINNLSNVDVESFFGVLKLIGFELSKHQQLLLKTTPKPDTDEGRSEYVYALLTAIPTFNDKDFISSLVNTVGTVVNTVADSPEVGMIAIPSGEGVDILPDPENSTMYYTVRVNPNAIADQYERGAFRSNINMNRYLKAKDSAL